MDDYSTLEKKLNPQPTTKTQPQVRQSTVNFIKQFARAYSYENKLKANLGNFIAN